MGRCRNSDRYFTDAEDQALLAGLRQIDHGRGTWAQVLDLYGRTGSISTVLTNRTGRALRKRASKLRAIYAREGRCDLALELALATNTADRPEHAERKYDEVPLERISSSQESNEDERSSLLPANSLANRALLDGINIRIKQLGSCRGMQPKSCILLPASRDRPLETAATVHAKSVARMLSNSSTRIGGTRRSDGQMKGDLEESGTWDVETGAGTPRDKYKPTDRYCTGGRYELEGNHLYNALAPDMVAAVKRRGRRISTWKALALEGVERSPTLSKSKAPSSTPVDNMASFTPINRSSNTNKDKTASSRGLLSISRLLESPSPDEDNFIRLDATKAELEARLEKLKKHKMAVGAVMDRMGCVLATDARRSKFVDDEPRDFEAITYDSEPDAFEEEIGGDNREERSRSIPQYKSSSLKRDRTEAAMSDVESPQAITVQPDKPDTSRPSKKKQREPSILESAKKDTVQPGRAEDGQHSKEKQREHSEEDLEAVRAEIFADEPKRIIDMNADEIHLLLIRVAAKLARRKAKDKRPSSD